jgi:hypothetical protein
VEAGVTRFARERASLGCGLDPVQHDLPVIAAILHDLQPLETDVFRLSGKALRGTPRATATEHGRQASVRRLRATIEPDGQADGARLALQAASLPDALQAAQDDRKVVAAAPLDLEPLEADGTRALDHPVRRSDGREMAEVGDDPGLLLRSARRLLDGGGTRRRRRLRGRSRRPATRCGESRAEEDCGDGEAAHGVSRLLE